MVENREKNRGPEIGERPVKMTLIREGAQHTQGEHAGLLVHA